MSSYHGHEAPSNHDRENRADRASSGQAAGWAKHAEALADWSLSHIVVRKDVYIFYTPDGKPYTAHASPTRERLIQHFRGEITLGFHSTSADGRCLGVSADIDSHDDRADPDRV